MSKKELLRLKTLKMTSKQFQKTKTFQQSDVKTKRKN